MKRKVEVTQLARMTRTRTRTGTIIGDSVKKIALIMTKITSRLRHYAMEISRYSCDGLAPDAASGNA
jgi:hypothetical protein